MLPSPATNERQLQTSFLILSFHTILCLLLVKASLTGVDACCYGGSFCVLRSVCAACAPYLDQKVDV